VLQWAREHHCQWGWLTPARAAEGRHLEVLMWVRENNATGEVWNEDHVRRCAGGPRMTRRRCRRSWEAQVLCGGTRRRARRV
jgi:hypothetical protein